MQIPTLSELHKMLRGARVGAGLAVGPDRWPGVRRFLVVLAGAVAAVTLVLVFGGEK